MFRIEQTRLSYQYTIKMKKLRFVVGAALMTTYLKTTDPTGRKPPSFGIGQFLFAVVLAVILFLLGQSMVRHRFFQGGREHRNGSIGQEQAHYTKMVKTRTEEIDQIGKDGLKTNEGLITKFEHGAAILLSESAHSRPPHGMYSPKGAI